ncbi:hypothetical protein SHA02_14560 [Salisediminibacterium halotolerans]|nr:DUF6544 family protein [Salisediminibacterium halotolerans]GEL08040.1 hypothetical protein SHA02_14560 [Salisediminibacterium halotolerans]
MKSLFTKYLRIVLPGTLIFISAPFLLGRLQMNRKIAKEKEKLLALPAINEEDESSPITIDNLMSLPAPVQNWLQSIGVIGQEKIRAVTLTQSGQMRLNPEQITWFKS